MKVTVTVTEDIALSAVMLELHNENGTIKPLNAKIFKLICCGYIFSYGESYCGNHQYDYERYLDKAREIVSKYFKH